MPRERTIAPFGVRSRRRRDQLPTHPGKPPTNSGGALRDASGAKSPKVKGRRWTELNMATDGGGIALEAGGGSIEG